MKIRNGFVSNSSSSSFIVVVKRPKDNETNYLEIIDFIIKHYYQYKSADTNFSSTIQEHTLSLETEIKELTKDLSFLEKQKEFLESLVKDSKLEKHMGNLLKYLNQKNTLKGNVRCGREIYKENPKSFLKDETYYLTCDITRIKDKAKNLNLRLTEIKKYNDDTWKIIGFEEDISHSPISSAIKELEEKGLAAILKKVTT